MRTLLLASFLVPSIALADKLRASIAKHGARITIRQGETAVILGLKELRKQGLTPRGLLGRSGQGVGEGIEGGGAHLDAGARKMRPSIPEHFNDVGHGSSQEKRLVRGAAEAGVVGRLVAAPVRPLDVPRHQADPAAVTPTPNRRSRVRRNPRSRRPAFRGWCASGWE